MCDGKSEILLATEKGFSIRFPEQEVRPIGRTGRGVRGIRLKQGDRVVGAEIVQPGNKLLTVTSRGYGKRTLMEEYPIQGRGGLGVMTIRCNEKIGSVVGVQQVDEEDQLLVITSDGNIVRMRVNEISLIGRNTQGVRLVGIREGNQVVSVEKLVE